RTREWLEAIGELEALSAFAALAFDNPGWTFPSVDSGTDIWEFENLGHPLIADSLRVLNDVRLGPPGNFLLVTGSNMSGKSTLLRALRVNLLLGQAGAPVCATGVRHPPTRLGTSFVIED